MFGCWNWWFYPRHSLIFSFFFMWYSVCPSVLHIYTCLVECVYYQGTIVVWLWLIWGVIPCLAYFHTSNINLCKLVHIRGFSLVNMAHSPIPNIEDGLIYGRQLHKLLQNSFNDFITRVAIYWGITFTVRKCVYRMTI